ncbi:MAG: helix-turn-helix domain-containing protein [Bacteroidales bacterium]|nr:helix-turn-helix domain-containing protein [Bacteroidales bacterium]
MKRHLVFTLAALLAAACSPGSQPEPVAEGPDGAVFHRMTVERLPELNAPRGFHQTLLLGDELTVIGGHTDAFKPIGTAEYLQNGIWHEVPLHYPHDGGFTAPLPDGTVMVGGGSAEPFGIGQTWGVEVYDPASHACRLIGIMDRKRAYASALPLPDGRVVIAGNWYADDAVEIWDTARGFSFFKEVNMGRQQPLILPTGSDDAILFSAKDARGNPAGALVDRLSGDAYEDPVLAQWSFMENAWYADLDGKIGEYTYLLFAFRRSDGEPGVLKVSGGVFSPLELEGSIPRKGLDGRAISWTGKLQADRSRRQAWIRGDDAAGRIYFACIGYDATFEGGPAPVTLFYAEHPDGDPFPLGETLVLSLGRLALAGGAQPDPPEGDQIRAYNYNMSCEAFIFHSEPLQKARWPWWAVLLVALVPIVMIVLTVFLLGRRRTPGEESASEEGIQISRNLMEQMSALIEEQQLFRRKNLRITDVASELATNKTYVSALLNNLSGETFTALITRLRVEYAQRLMREHPDLLLDDVADQSGFSSRTTFFRSFKAIAGTTPYEWKKSL